MLQRCTSCERKNAVYKRSYSGEKLCNKCFCLSIERKAKATIAKYHMLRFDDKTAIGVSGGKDSMTLLHLLVKAEKPFVKAELSAVTVDEGIAGYRDEALKIAEQGCEELGIPHVITSFKEMFGYDLDDFAQELKEEEVKGGLTLCSYCGVLRRRALNQTARKLGASKLATAHNLDDEAQTILLNILHGDPLRIARVRPVSSPTHPSFVPRIKPLCTILERETALYAFLKNLRLQSKPCPYAPSALRNDIRSMLNRMEEKHPGLKYTVYRSAEKLWSPIESSMQKEELRQCMICGEPTVSEMCQPCKMLQNFQHH